MPPPMPPSMPELLSLSLSLALPPSLSLALPPALALPLLFVAGCLAGTINVLAGGGSFLTVPLLIFMGLPAGIANGTNRIGILLQNVSAVWSFRRDGLLERADLWRSALPAIPGGILGTWLALIVSDTAFQRILAFLMVALSLWSLRSPRPAPAAGSPPPRPWALALGFAAVGVYGGFVQAGVGFLFLTLTTTAGFDLVRGNAIKVLAIGSLTVLSLAIFTWQGRVDWALGLALGVGNFFGGLWGARLTVLKGHAWVRRVVTAMILLFAVKLLINA